MRVERVNERSKSRAQLSPYGKKDWATFLTKYSHTHTQNIVMIMMTWYFIYDIVQNCFTFSMKCHAQLRFSIDFEWKTLELDIFCEDAHVYLMNEVLWRLLMKFEQNRWKRETLIQNPFTVSTLERIIIYNEDLLHKINKFQEKKTRDSVPLVNQVFWLWF